MSRTELIQKTNRMTNRRRMTKRNLSKTATRTRTRRTVASRTAASDLPARGRQYQRTGTVLASQSLSEPGDSKEKLTRYRRSITSNHNIFKTCYTGCKSYSKFYRNVVCFMQCAANWTC